jgi:ACS family glucarate transporter-like MFS transporter
MALPKPKVSFEADQQAEPGLRDSPQRWWLLVLLFAAMLISYVHRGAFSVAAPFMSKDLQLSKAGIGIVLSGFFWIYAFMQVPAGWVVDRFGVKRAYSLAFIFWSLATALTGLARGIVSLVGLRAAMGTGQAITFPATARAVANSFPERERGTVTAIYLTGVRLGQAFVSWFGAFFLARYSWKLFFLFIGLIPLIWLFPWTRYLSRWETNSNARSQSAAAPDTSFWKSLLLLRHKSVFGIFLGFFAYDYVWFVFITWLPGYLVLERKFTTQEMGVYSAAPYLPMSLIIMLSGFLSDWLVRKGIEEKLVRRAMIVVGLAIGCLIVPAGLVTDKITAVWLLTISLCGLGICSPNTWTLTQAVCDKKIVGTVSGIQNFGGNVGGILAPALTGFIAHATDSFALAFGLCGLIMVVGMFAYWFLISDEVKIPEENGPQMNTDKTRI